MKDWNNIDSLFEELSAGNKVALGKAITLIESTRQDHKDKAYLLLQKCKINDKHIESIRIGLTGVPGVGKSTFIESFGKYLIEEKQRKVAVLAIDPSSQVSRGSILGDKTRMNELAVNPNAFIRPSAAGESLGGVARRTREAIVLCETAGYDTIFIETVGVGQSETTVKQLCDFFLLLMLYGAGDELQGIKRGIMEMADTILVNKCEENMQLAKRAAKEYSNAMHLFPAKENGWYPKVFLSSGINGTGIEKTWETIVDFQEKARNNESWEKNRNEQELWWFKSYCNQLILEKIKSTSEWKEATIEMSSKIENGELSALEAAKIIVDKNIR